MGVVEVVEEEVVEVEVEVVEVVDKTVVLVDEDVVRDIVEEVDDDEVVPKMLVNENGSKVLVVVGRAAAAECRPRQLNEGFDMSPAGYMRDFSGA